MSTSSQANAGSSLGVALEGLRSTVDKRLQTLEYLKRAHLGKMYWFNTVLLEQRDLVSLFEPTRMRMRTNRFAVLGMSLSALLDIPAAHDFLRGLLSLVQEFETVPDDKFDRKNQRNLFRVSSRGRKGNNSGGDYSMGLGDSADASYLITPNIPFDLDYFQVFLTLCDMLIETYRKISTHLGPSSKNAAGCPPPPALSTSGPNSSTAGGNRWIDRAGASSTSLSPALLDTISKVDVRLKKLILMTSKEIDGYARAAIKRELSTLIGVSGDDGEYADA